MPVLKALQAPRSARMLLKTPMVKAVSVVLTATRDGRNLHITGLEKPGLNGKGEHEWLQHASSTAPSALPC